jgi:hypothetical protein
MKIDHIFFIFCLVLIVTSKDISGQEISGDGLKLRTEPTAQSQTIRVLPFLTRVEILDKHESLIVIDGISSHWYKVSTNNDTGWVFGGYLSKDTGIPKVKDKSFIAVYRIKNININVDSFGFENILKRLKKVIW